MPNAQDSAGGRHGRDRNLLLRSDRLGPYEAAYDTLRGYDQPAPLVARPPAAEFLFRGREEDEAEA
jgi:hypothetical protein